MPGEIWRDRRCRGPARLSGERRHCSFSAPVPPVLFRRWPDGRSRGFGYVTFSEERGTELDRKWESSEGPCFGTEKEV